MAKIFDFNKSKHKHLNKIKKSCGTKGQVIDFEQAKQKSMKEEEKRMDVTIKEVIEKYPVVQKLSMVEGFLPVKMTYRIGKTFKKMELIVKDFNNARQKLFVKYGKEDEKNKGQMSIPPENVEAFTKEIEDFTDQTVQIEVMPISLIEFYRYEKKLNNQRYQISGKEMFDVPFLWTDLDKIDELPDEEKKA